MTALEASIAVALVGAFLGSAVVYQRQALVGARELALKADLQCLRAGISFFEARRDRLPATLEEVLVQSIGRARSEHGTADWSLQEYGQRPADAFGNRYHYDPATGRVASATPGYETW